MDKIACKKTTDGNKIIFYSQKFNSLWQYYKLAATQGYILFLMLFVFFAIISIIMETIKGQNMNGLIFIPICIFFGIVWLIPGYRAKNFFFELSVNKKEISFYSYRQQWSYKVAAIEKIIKGYEEADTLSFPIFFVVRIEGESKTIEVFDNSDTFLQVYDVVQILKEICAYTGLKFETQSGCSLLP
jgi:hypothetical protein